MIQGWPTFISMHGISIILDLISGGILGTTCKKTITKVYFWKDMMYQLPYDYRDISLF